jgi:hypothetical protein
VARARNIKPGFYHNDTLAECSVWARLIFPGLWMMADRQGRLEDRPARIKAALLPYDAQNVDKLLTELHNHGFICRYSIGASKYIQIINFDKHQNPHCKEPVSTIPAPPGDSYCPVRARCESDAGTVQEQEQNSSDPADSGFPLPNPPSRIPIKGESGALPFPSEGFKAAWARWEQHRREIGKRLTPTSVRQQFAKLAGMGEARAVAAIEHSIANGYQGIYEPTGRSAGVNGRPDPGATLANQAHESMTRGAP